MPRNAAGQYTLPAGNPVITDTLIESDGWANPTMEDLGAEVEDSLSRDGKGAMRAALGIIDGSEANPGLRFIGETGSGLYRESDGRWWLVVKGVQKILVSELVGVIIDDNLTIEGDVIINGAGGLVTAPVFIDGVADEVQLRIQGNDPEQDEHLVDYELFDGSIIAYVQGDGRPVWLINSDQANHVRLENSIPEALLVKATNENSGGEVRLGATISAAVGTNHVAHYPFGGQADADTARLSLLEQTGGGNLPGGAFETSNLGAGYNKSFTKRLSAGQTDNLAEWRDETGAVMSAIDFEGNFVGGPGGGGSGGNTPTSTGNQPVGQIAGFPLNPPNLGTEWLICDGTSYLTANFPELFAYLGYAYGGAGPNFNVPDLRGEFLRGQDLGRGQDPDAASRGDRGDGTTGDAPGTTQLEGVGPHQHSYEAPNGVVNLKGFDPNPLRVSFQIKQTTAGTGMGNETRPDNVYVVLCIKAVV